MNALSIKAYDLRQGVLDIIVSGGGGHIGGDMSSMEIMLTLYARMNVSPETQHDPDRDRALPRGDRQAGAADAPDGDGAHGRDAL